MNHRRLSFVALGLFTALPLACSDHGADDGTHANAAHAGSTSAGSGGSAGSAPMGGAPAGGAEEMAGMGPGDSAPEAPVMKSVEPLGGGLHVTWTNLTPDCDKVVLLRSKGGGAYATAYTLAGVATSQHDGQAKPPGEYCYKARCIKGDLSSADSGEKCGTP